MAPPKFFPISGEICFEIIVHFVHQAPCPEYCAAVYGVW